MSLHQPNDKGFIPAYESSRNRLFPGRLIACIEILKSPNASYQPGDVCWNWNVVINVDDPGITFLNADELWKKANPGFEGPEMPYPWKNAREGVDYRVIAFAWDDWRDLSKVDTLVMQADTDTYSQTQKGDHLAPGAAHEGDVMWSAFDPTCCEFRETITQSRLETNVGPRLALAPLRMKAGLMRRWENSNESLDWVTRFPATLLGTIWRTDAWDRVNGGGPLSPLRDDEGNPNPEQPQRARNFAVQQAASDTVFGINVVEDASLGANEMAISNNSDGFAEVEITGTSFNPPQLTHGEPPAPAEDMFSAGTTNLEAYLNNESDETMLQLQQLEAIAGPTHAIVSRCAYFMEQWGQETISVGDVIHLHEGHSTRGIRRLTREVSAMNNVSRMNLATIDEHLGRLGNREHQFLARCRRRASTYQDEQYLPKWELMLLLSNDTRGDTWVAMEGDSTAGALVPRTPDKFDLERLRQHLGVEGEPSEEDYELFNQQLTQLFNTASSEPGLPLLRASVSRMPTACLMSVEFCATILGIDHEDESLRPLYEATDTDFPGDTAENPAQGEAVIIYNRIRMLADAQQTINRRQLVAALTSPLDEQIADLDLLGEDSGNAVNTGRRPLINRKGKRRRAINRK